MLKCNEEKRNDQDPIGLPNVGNTCYMNSVFQILSQYDKLQETLSSNSSHRKNHNNESCFMCNVEKLLSIMISDAPYDSNSLSNLLKLIGSQFCDMSKTFELNQQSDAAEFFILLIDLGDASIRESYWKTLFHNVSSSKIGYCSKCVRENIPQQSNEDGCILPLHVQNDDEMKRKLTMASIEEKMYDYTCDLCHTKGTTSVTSQYEYGLNDNMYVIQIIREADGIERRLRIPFYMKNNTFILFGIINYRGIITQGHYKSYVRSAHSGSWFSTNDNEIKEVTEEYISLNAKPALLFYRKKSEYDKNLNHQKNNKLCQERRRLKPDVKKDEATYDKKRNSNPLRIKYNMDSKKKSRVKLHVKKNEATYDKKRNSNPLRTNNNNLSHTKRRLKPYVKEKDVTYDKKRNSNPLRINNNNLSHTKRRLKPYVKEKDVTYDKKRNSNPLRINNNNLSHTKRRKKSNSQNSQIEEAHPTFESSMNEVTRSEKYTFSTFESHPEEAAILYYLNSGYGRFQNLDNLNDEKVVERLKEEISHEVLTSEEKQDLINNFYKVRGRFTSINKDGTTNDSELLICGACGIREFQRDDPKEHFVLCPITNLPLLVLTKEEVQEFEEIINQDPIRVPSKNKIDVEVIHIWKLYSKWKDPLSKQWYHLHPESIVNVRDNQNDDDNKTDGSTCTSRQELPYTYLCPKCHTSILSKERPKFSIASGIDFGNPFRIISRMPSRMEIALIAQLRHYFNIVKIQTSTYRDPIYWHSALKGHSILFKHDSPAQCMSKKTLESIISSIKLHFVSPSEEKDNLMQRTLGTDILEGEGTYVYTWLSILSKTHQYYDDLQIPNVDNLDHIMNEARKSLIENAMVSEDSYSLFHEKTLGDDVAQVRTKSATAENCHNQKEHYTPSTQGRKDNVTMRHCLLMSQEKNSFKSPTAATKAVFESLGNALGIKKSKRESEPINEFSNNEYALVGAFPHIFTLGKAYEKDTGTLTEMQCYHLLHQFTTVAATDITLQAFLQDQRLRHGNIRSTIINLKGREDVVANVHKMISEPTFELKVKSAIDDPKGKDAKEITRNIFPVLSISSKSAATFGTLDRNNSVGMMIAQSRRYNSGAVAFLTFSFNDVNDSNTVRLSIRTLNNKDFPTQTDENFFDAMRNNSKLIGESDEVDMSYYERLKRLTQNPVAAASEFVHFIYAIIVHLLGIKPEELYRKTEYCRQRRKGIFGMALAFAMVIEAHAKGTLHGHLVIYGSISPKLLQAAANHATLSKYLAEALESMYKAELSVDTHITDLVRKWWNTQQKDPLLRRYNTPAIMCRVPQVDSNELTSESNTNFNKFVEKVVVTSQLHSENHSHTCHKGLEGKYGCREGYPTGPSPTTHPLQLAELNDEDTEEDKKNGYKVMESISSRPKPHNLILDANEIDPQKVFPQQDKRIIIWEIKRPLIKELPKIPEEYFQNVNQTPAADTSSNISRDIIRDDCGELSKWIKDQLRMSLSESTFATISDQTLSKLDSQELVNLFKYLVKMLPKQNLSVVQFNPIISALTGSNAAVYHLGSETQSVNALCYIAPYMTKNKVPLLDTLTTIAQARKDIEKRPSKAENKGTDFRFVAHLIERILNRLDLRIEISDIQIAGSLLGMKSMSTSDIFTWYNGYCHMLAIRKEQLSGKSANQYKDSSPIEDCESLASSDSYSDDNTIIEDDAYKTDQDKQEEKDIDDKEEEEDDALLLEAEESFNSLKSHDTCAPLYTISRSESIKKERIPIPYPDLFRYRGKELRMLNRMEYACLVNIVKDECSKTEQNETHSIPGRPKNPRFQFGEGIAIKGHFAQTLRSKQATLRQIGKPPTKPKTMPSIQNKKKYDTWKKHADRFGEFWLSFLRPEPHNYDRTSTNKLSYNYETLCSWLAEIKMSKQCIDQFRLATFERNLEAFQTSKGVQKCTKAYRFRNRKIWSEKEKKEAMVQRSLNYDTRRNGNNELEEDEEDIDGSQYTQAKIINCINQINTVMKNVKSLEALFSIDDTTTNLLELDDVQDNHDIVLDEDSINPDVRGSIASLSSDLTDKDGITIEEMSNLKNNPFNMDIFPGLGRKSNNGPSVKIASSEAYFLDLMQKTEKHIEQCNLTDDKRKFIDSVNDYLCKLKTFQMTKDESYDLKALKLYLSGGPGTGKSYVVYTIQSLISRLDLGKCQSMSFMGVAAGLTDGVTIHSFARINVESKRESEDDVISDLKDITAFTTDINDLIMIIIDEISQVTAKNLAIIHARLVQALGLTTANKISFIFVGDFNQQLAIMGMNLASGTVQMVCSDKHITEDGIQKFRFREDSPVRAGIQFFLKDTKRFELTKQNRSYDPVHNKVLVDMYENGKIRSNHLSYLKLLKKATYQNDPSWLKATVIVRTNQEIKLLEHVLSSKFAKATRNIVIRWKMKKIHFEGIGNELDTDAYDEKSPVLWQYFIKSADAYLSHTINNSLKLSNGTKVRYHSLTFGNITEETECREMINNALPGDIIDLPYVPLSINVQLFVENNDEAENITKRKAWSTNRTLIKSDAVIPICQSGPRHKATKYLIEYAETSAARVLSTPYFAIDTAFAITSDKCEGRTMDKIILAIARSPTDNKKIGRAFDMASFFVSLSRAKSSENIRILPCYGDYSLQSQLHYLQKLKRHDMITNFLRSWKRTDDEFMQFDEAFLLSLYKKNT